VARDPIEIDRDKLRAAVRKLGNKYVFYMLDHAIDLLSPVKVHKIAKKYLDLKRLRPDAERATKTSLLTDVKLFEKASLAGEYYQSFDVNSRNCTQQSTGTSAWIAQCLRLLDRCVANASKGNPTEVREAMDILFGLLSHIDEGRDDIIFFADEGGSWQVGVDWARVLPAWLKVLSATAGPEEFAVRITSLLSHHYRYGRHIGSSFRRDNAPVADAGQANGATGADRLYRIGDHLAHPGAFNDGIRDYADVFDRAGMISRT
jgi:hypothetical protein